MDLTLFELHLDEASFTANAPFTGGETEEEADSSTSGSGDDDGGRRARDVLPAILGLVALVGVIALLKKLRGGSDEEPTLEEPPTTEAEVTP